MESSKSFSPSHGSLETSDDLAVVHKLDPLPIRSYALEFPFSSLSNEFKSLKTPKFESAQAHYRELPAAKEAAGIPLRKFIPNVALDRHKPAIIPNFQSFSETAEFSAGLMLAKLHSKATAPTPMKDIEKKFQPVLAHSSILSKNGAILGNSRSKLSLLAANKNYLGKGSHKKSKNLLELSWPDDAEGEYTLYAPISLPFILREDIHKEEGSHVVGNVNSHSITKRPTVQHVDEANRNAAMLFHDILNENNNDAYSGNFIHIQLPSILPEIDRDGTASNGRIQNIEDNFEPKRKSTPQRSNEGRTDNYKHSSFEDLPEGKLGKLVIYRNGKVKLKIGNYVFDVNGGSECSFCQEVGCHFESNSEFIFLGRCNHRIVLTPDIESMVETMERDSVTQRP